MGSVADLARGDEIRGDAGASPISQFAVYTNNSSSDERTGCSTQCSLHVYGCLRWRGSFLLRRHFTVPLKRHVQGKRPIRVSRPPRIPVRPSDEALPFNNITLTRLPRNYDRQNRPRRSRGSWWLSQRDSADRMCAPFVRLGGGSRGRRLLGRVRVRERDCD